MVAAIMGKLRVSFETENINCLQLIFFIKLDFLQDNLEDMTKALTISDGSDEDKNKEAERLNALGLKAWKVEDFELAKVKFTEAYYQCAPGYNDEKSFKDNMKHAEAVLYNKEGVALHNDEKYEEAVKKYEQALKACPNEKIGSINVYKKNIALSFQGLGYQCHGKNKYIEATEYYKKAYQKLTECYESDESYEGDMKQAESKIYNNEGNQLYYEKKYEEAVKKYLQALEICPSDRVEAINAYKRNIANCCKK